MKPNLSPSILAAELINLKTVLKELDPAKVDFIHLDVMDGHFVPQLSFGEQIAAEVGKNTAIPLDVHLMVSNPEVEVPKYYTLEPRYITFHVEATEFSIRLLQDIRAHKIGAGIALNPGTPVSRLEPLLDYLDLVLIMSVEPGFYGQSFIPYSTKKLQEAKELFAGRDIKLSVDGGVKATNIGDLAKLGIDMFVAGSAVFKGGDIPKNIAALEAGAAGKG